MDFKNLLRVARRRWKSIVVMFALAIIGAVTVSVVTPPQYESTAKLYVSADVDETQQLGTSFFLATQVKSYAVLANHRTLMQEVIDELDLPLTPEDLAGKVTATVEPETIILSVTVRDGDPLLAQEIARVHSELFVEYIKDLETPPTSDESLIKPTITDPATYNDSPVVPNTPLNLLIAAALGLLLGSALALIRELLDTTISSLDQMEEVIDAPVMASVGVDPAMEKKPLLSDIKGFSPRGEAFRMLRTNLAVALAQAGRRVLLIDGDLRRPRVAGLLGLESKIGLTTVLVGRTQLDDSIQRHEPSGIYFLACGPTPPNPSEILQSRATHDLLHRLRDQFDAVIIDAPPLLPVADAAILATAADGAIIVARHGRTKRDQLKAAAQRLDQVGAKLFGVVVNMIPRRYANSYYYYYYDEVEAAGSRKKNRETKRSRAS